MDILAGADIHAAGGLAGDDQLGGYRKFARDDDLLHIAAGKVAAELLGAGGLDLVLPDQLLRQGFRLLPPDDAAVQHRLPVAAVDHGVIGDGAIQRQSFGNALLRDEGHALPDPLVDRRFGHIPAADLHAAVQRLADAEDALGQLGLAVALHAGHAQDLPAAKLERQAVDLGFVAVAHDHQVLDPQGGFAQGDRFPFHAGQLTADHHLGQVLAGHVLLVDRTDRFAGAQNGNAVGDLHDLL